jgi:hypothetical protein
MSLVPRPSRRLLAVLDVALVGWTCALLGVGVAATREVRGLGELGDTVILASGALRQTADLVDELSGLPFVGAEADRLADRVRRTARSANRQAAASKVHVRRLAVLLGAALVLVPVMPLAVYVPLRVAWLREGRRIRRALRRDDGRLDAWLARRALLLVPPERLPAPADERALADAELARLGFRRPVPR